MLVIWSIFPWISWPFVYLLCKNVYSDPLPIFHFFLCCPPLYILGYILGINPLSGDVLFANVCPRSLSVYILGINPLSGGVSFANVCPGSWVCSQQLWVTRLTPGTEAEARRSGTREKFRSWRRKYRQDRGDLIVFQCGDVPVQDKEPESPHCSSGLSRMQEIGLISLDSCGKSWLCQLNFSYNLSNHDWWENEVCPQQLLQEHGVCWLEGNWESTEPTCSGPGTSFSHPHDDFLYIHSPSIQPVSHPSLIHSKPFECPPCTVPVPGWEDKRQIAANPWLSGAHSPHSYGCQAGAQCKYIE